MQIVESFLTGTLDVRNFIIELKTNVALQKDINSLVPYQAKNHSEHPFWKAISYESMSSQDFNLFEFMKWTHCFRGRIGDDLNLFATLSCVYCYHFPNFICTTMYNDAFDLYLDVGGEYFEGPEVECLVEEIIRSVLSLPTKSKRIKVAREKIKVLFHLTSKIRPQWIQGPEWPMGHNSPMAYVGKKNISDGIAYTFRDVDSDEIRIVQQFY